MWQIDEQNVYRSSLLGELPWLEHGFGTRRSHDWPRGPRASLKQIHSNRSLVVSGCDRVAGEADALITAEPGRLVSVKTADCLPLLMVSVEPRVVAAIHAGWRGTAADIAGETLRRLRREFGVAPAGVYVAIGPGIGSCCYEVGPEVLAQFRDLLPGLPDSGGKGMLDLAEANRRQLLREGVCVERIETGAPCTCCTAGEFFSYRRSPGEPGRMISAIGIRSGV